MTSAFKSYGCGGDDIDDIAHDCLESKEDN